uniref:Uncharacterized protein n=1 Tax=Rhabditophanes sp. KR3021 TaxID=114890 RepID=A0AC35U874_9BILA
MIHELENVDSLANVCDLARDSPTLPLFSTAIYHGSSKTSLNDGYTIHRCIKCSTKKSGKRKHTERGLAVDQLDCDVELTEEQEKALESLYRKRTQSSVKYRQKKSRLNNKESINANEAALKPSDEWDDDNIAAVEQKEQDDLVQHAVCLWLN